MLWRLPASVRSLVLPTCHRYSSTVASSRIPEPLRILFCGSDEFSIASLRALNGVKHDAPQLIDSIHVVHRPAKPAGRGLRTLREVPIKQVSTNELALPTHAIDTFTGWTPPTPINLAIAVSFGLFVPPRILGLARYGGLNVHPSLLPDLRGPAPIEHALLRRREYTGVSIQTLHSKQFDRGTILAQTPAPGIRVPPGLNAVLLEEQLARTGAEMLVDVLKTHRFAPPLEDVGWYDTSDGPIDHAPKITKKDRFIDFSVNTIENILSIQHALGDSWCILPNGDRLIIHKIADTGKIDERGGEPGIWVQKGYDYPLFRDASGKTGVILESTYAGFKAGQGNAKLLRMFPAQEREAVRVFVFRP
ncbi:Formyltransferase [Cucurbitaria berberidis CBS 394.84]|uniref:methionyl-tRNA formyltransferase n=1 Tax=Cucurbitaria berberidis CBS 394.84 TaxID=1168544 RepID=A0A9P4GN98_9PLEO|nr:Formyltransferase [Cucurbitaria berberidis CBS 394.84]KAF1849588.1 Formyltransferase [Cucurbitaria berberidis CBS 394.84]